MRSIYSDTDRMIDEDEEASFAIPPPAQGIVLVPPHLSSVSARKLAASLYNSSPRSHIRWGSASISNSDSPPPSVSTNYLTLSSKHHNASIDNLYLHTNDGLRTSSNRTPRGFEEKKAERLTYSDSDAPIGDRMVHSSLHEEIKQALLRARELKDSEGSAQKEVDGLLEQFANEIRVLHAHERENNEDARVCWMSEKLKKEQCSRRDLEIENSKISRYLVEAENAVVRIGKELEKEKRARKLMEDVCDELAREIGEDKAAVETLKREQSKSRQQTLEMMDAWHEERTQMKLSETKIMVFNKLMRDLDVLLDSMKAQGVDASLKLQGEHLRASMEELQRDSYGSSCRMAGSKNYSRDHIISLDTLNSSPQNVRKDSQKRMHDRSPHSFRKDCRHTISSKKPINQPVRYQTFTPELTSPKWEDHHFDRGIAGHRSSIGSLSDWTRPIKNNSLQARLILEDQMNGLDSHLQHSRRRI